MSMISQTIETLIPKKRGPKPIPRGDASSAARVQEKLDAAVRDLEELVRQHPAAALAATLEDEPGPAAEAFDALKQRIAAQERVVADLQSALVGARVADEQLVRAQQARLYKEDLTELKRLLRQRDDAARAFAVAAENISNAYQRLIEAGKKAERRLMGIPGGASLIQGAKVKGTELYRLCAHELVFHSDPWPKTPDNKNAPKFPLDHSSVITAIGRGKLRPITETLAEHTAALVAELEGKAP